MPNQQARAVPSCAFARGTQLPSFRLLPLLAAATICTAAQAADLSGPAGSGGYKDGPVYGPTWTGFYIGAHGGYGSGDWTGNLTYTDGPSGFPGSRTVDSNGWFGGGQVGYNKQIGTIVIGIEADIA